MANGENGRDRLYKLLPAVYRERDAAEGYPLRALLRLVTDQADILQVDIQRLWDNFFIETCERWAIPYIGDLVSNNLLHDTSRIKTPNTAHELFPDLAGRDLRPDIAIRTRADVAKTIYYRRRKGTLPMLEELARKPGKVVRNEGDVDGALARAARHVQAEYYVPHHAHATMEPPAATVRIADGKCEAWAGVQSPQVARDLIAKRLGMPVENVRVRTMSE